MYNNTFFIVFVLLYFLTMVEMRLFMNELTMFYYNKSRIKKIKKEENIIDKLLYWKYKDRVPKLFYILYYLMLLLHPIAIIAYLILSKISLLESYANWVIGAVALYDFIYVNGILILFWSNKSGWNFGKWLKK